MFYADRSVLRNPNNGPSDISYERNPLGLTDCNRFWTCDVRLLPGARRLIYTGGCATKIAVHGFLSLHKVMSESEPFDGPFQVQVSMKPTSQCLSFDCFVLWGSSINPFLKSIFHAVLQIRRTFPAIMQSSKNILVTGATGNQGGAVIDALVASPSITSFHIFALTRSASSAKAQALATKRNVTVVVGNLDNCDAIFTQLDQIWGVFSVQTPIGKGQTVATEETQGKALIDAAIAHHVEHFVYTSVDRHGPDSDTNPTTVPHFASKHRIEQHLRSQTATSKTQMTWTILRPVTFYDNLTADYLGKGFASMWRAMGEKRMQFVSCRDIGRHAARAFEQPAKFHSLAISLAGDDMNYAEAARVFRAEVGYALPTSPALVGTLLKWMLRDIGMMFLYFETVGYAAELEGLRREDSELQDFKTWLKQSSHWVKR